MEARVRREMEAAAATPSPKPSGARKAVGGGKSGLPPSSQQRGKATHGNATHNKPTAAAGPRTAAAKNNAHFIERRGGHTQQARCRDSVPCLLPRNAPPYAFHSPLSGYCKSPQVHVELIETR